MATLGGLRPFSSVSIGAGSAPTVAFNLAASESDDIFEGDLMVMEATGTVTACKTVIEVAVVGVFVGCEYTNDEGQRVWDNKYTKTIARSDSIAYVNTNPFQLFKIKIATSDVDATLTQEAIGLNYDLDYAGTGSSVTGKSAMTMETVGGAATGQQVRLVGLTNDDGSNDLVGDNATTYTHAIVQLSPVQSFWIGLNGI